MTPDHESPAADSPALIITIDGPAGTGKSTVAHQLALRLGLEYLDTGAMYRATALLALERDLDLADGTVLATILAETDLHFDWEADPPRLMLGVRDVSSRIRDRDVNSLVSVVAALPPVRAALVDRQRRIAANHPRLVSEGRDQGSVVFPDAPVRFFLDASVEERARRRVRQDARAGRTVDEQLVRRDIEARDQLDSTRTEAPLVRPEGAVIVDTSNLSQTAVVDELERVVRERLPQADLKP